MAESRLARRSIKKTRQQLYMSLAGIVALLFIALNFGPYLLGAVGTTIDTITNKASQSGKINITSEIQAPVLDPIPGATPSAQINITGRSYYPKGIVELYVNDARRTETDVDSSQNFNFKNIRLSEGENTLKVRTIIDSKKSPFSGEEQILYSKNPPKLDISSPSDHQVFHKGDEQISVKGSTDPENSVNINGFIAIVDSAGNFSHEYNLSNGDNKLTVLAIAPSGATFTKEITVSYSE